MIYYKCQEGWETLKDHPIDRAGDLKHRPISGGAPKNAFFIVLSKKTPTSILRLAMLVLSMDTSLGGG